MTEVKNNRGKRARNKGNRYELEIIKKLKEIGYTGCKSTRSESRNMDSNNIDVIDTENKLPCYIQCKYTQNTPNYFDIKAGCSLIDKPYVVVWKKANPDGKRSSGEVAIVDLNYFLNLIKLPNNDTNE